MTQEEWNEFVKSLIEAKRPLQEAFSVMDGTEGMLGSSEHALGAALESIDPVHAAEAKYAEGQGLVVDDVLVGGGLPGFAVGT